MAGGPGCQPIHDNWLFPVSWRGKNVFASVCQLCLPAWQLLLLSLSFTCLINIQSWKLENPPLIISVFRPDLHLLKYSVDICLWIDLCHFRFCHLCTLFLVFLFSSFYLIGVLSAPSSLQVFFLLLICSSSIYWFVTYASLLVTLLLHSLKHLYLT
jgi:hypothetical protein